MATSSPAWTSTRWSPSAQRRPEPTAQGCEAVEPILVESRPGRGLRAVDRRRQPLPESAAPKRFLGSDSEIRARYVVVADGSNSRFGRALGTGPGQAISRSEWRCGGTTDRDRSDDPFIESHLDLRDPSGAVVPGYGWIFPLGNGLVNVGVGLLTRQRTMEGCEHDHT